MTSLNSYCFVETGGKNHYLNKYFFFNFYFGENKTTVLTKDHQAKDPEEKARVEAEGWQIYT